jgi:hypothetical protein
MIKQRIPARNLPSLASTPGLVTAGRTAASAPIDIGSRLELFADGFMIDSMKGVRLKLHEPRSMGPVFVFDKPWEGIASGYVTVFKDGDLFRMYYRGWSDPMYTMKSALRPGEHVVPEHPPFTCYAESRNGITWVRPSLGLIEFMGSKDNNIVWAGDESHNFAPFMDDNPESSSSHRYKAVGSSTISGKPVLLGFVSADGRRWEKVREEPIMTDGEFRSLNVVFWDVLRNQYTAIYRDFSAEVRTIKHSTSKDFLNWAPGQWADFGDAPEVHIYTNGTVPYFRAPQIYLALPRRFIPWKTYFKEFETTYPGASDAILMSSRDGIHWHRFEEAFIRPGRDERNWMHRANTPARGIVPTGPEELSIYVERNYTFPTNQVERLVLRMDGFVSAHAGYPGGELITKPLLLSADNLVLNFSTSANGSIRIEIQDLDSHPLPGFSLDDSPLIWGDQIAAIVPWKYPDGKTDSGPLAHLSGKPVRLRLVMRDADVFSMQFK